MYKPTASLPDLSHDVARDAAYNAADVIVKALPGIVRNDADRDALETALGDAIIDVATGKFTCFDAGQDDHYDEKGNCL